MIFLFKNFVFVTLVLISIILMKDRSMALITLVCAVLFSIFSTSVMAYIAMATPIGPWMGPTLALLGILLMRFFPSYTTEKVLLSVVAGSIGGIMAIAFGFSFPTLYFLDKPFFTAWASNPYQFISGVTLLASAAGFLGLWVASISAKSLLEDQQLAFPVGTSIYKITSSLNNVAKLKQLLGGFFATTIYSCAQMSSWFQTHILPENLVLSRSFSLGLFSIPSIQFTMSMMPMLWSIGFIAGSMITVPLLIGSLSKIFIVDILNKYYFSELSISEFLFAFCSGMVVIGAFYGLISMPKQLFDFLQKWIKGSTVKTDRKSLLMVFFTALPIFIFVSYVFFQSHFSFPAQCYSILFSIICAYQIAVIAGKIGLALLGRFATFVMVPGMFLFGLDALQVTVLATFVEACGGIATDGLFGRKAGMLAGIDQKRIARYQLFGVVVCSITLGVVMWLLVNHFELGSEVLFAERAQGRALLVKAIHFDYYVVLCGIAYGFILKCTQVNPMLVLGGLLMPLSMTLGLVFGGISSLLVGKKIDLEPLCSGMLAAYAFFMIIQAVIVFMH